MVILVTGKSESGKTRYARLLAEELRASGKEVRILDGDVFRMHSGNKDFSDVGRLRNLKDISASAAMAEMAGCICIVAAIAPRRDWRDMMRKEWKESRLVYMPGGTLWPGTEYERPADDEF